MTIPGLFLEEDLYESDAPLNQAAGQQANAQMRYVTQDLRDRAKIEIKPIEE